VAVIEQALAPRLEIILPVLDEWQRRMLMAVEAQAWSPRRDQPGGPDRDVSATTVRKGLAEIAQATEPSEQARRPGGGRKPPTQTDPQLLAVLCRLVDRGHTRRPAALDLASPPTRSPTAGPPDQLPQRAKLLKALGYRLQATRKTKEGNQYPDHNAQLCYLTR